MNGADYLGIIAFIFTGILFLAGTFMASRALRPHHPDPEKLSIYECGEEAVSLGQIPFNSGFFIIALIFVLFELELVFLFPWAVVFSEMPEGNNNVQAWAGLALAEMLTFVAVLFVGLVYAWAKGHLNWIKPVTKPTETPAFVPHELYMAVNKRYSDFIKQDQAI